MGSKLKFVNYLNEEFLKYLTGYGHQSFPVFTNPNKKEMFEVGLWARYIIDFKLKKIYVWDANKSIHDWVDKQLHLPDNVSNWPKKTSLRISFGDGSVENNKIDGYLYYWHPSKEDRPDIEWLRSYFNFIEIRQMKETPR